MVPHFRSRYWERSTAELCSALGNTA